MKGLTPKTEFAASLDSVTERVFVGHGLGCSPKTYIGNLKFPAPVGDDFALTVQTHPSVAAHIARLLPRCRPANISRLIVAIVIGKAINRMAGRWARADVRKKRGERLSPFLANGYPPRPITGVLRTLRIIATLVHRLPTGVFGGIYRAMFVLSIDHLFVVETST
jgi:hypothetical protein